MIPDPGDAFKGSTGVYPGNFRELCARRPAPYRSNERWPPGTDAVQDEDNHFPGRPKPRQFDVQRGRRRVLCLDRQGPGRRPLPRLGPLRQLDADIRLPGPTTVELREVARHHQLRIEVDGDTTTGDPLADASQECGESSTCFGIWACLGTRTRQPQFGTLPVRLLLHRQPQHLRHRPHFSLKARNDWIATLAEFAREINNRLGGKIIDSGIYSTPKASRAGVSIPATRRPTPSSTRFPPTGSSMGRSAGSGRYYRRAHHQGLGARPPPGSAASWNAEMRFRWAPSGSTPG